MPPMALCRAIDAHAAADVDELVDLAQRCFQHDGIGGFGGDVAVLAEGDADGGGLHRGRVVDAVAEEERGSALDSSRTISSFSSGLLPRSISVMPTSPARWRTSASRSPESSITRLT